MTTRAASDVRRYDQLRFTGMGIGPDRVPLRCHRSRTQAPVASHAGTFPQLATDAATEAGFENFVPDACLVNRYQARREAIIASGTKMSGTSPSESSLYRWGFQR